MQLDYIEAMASMAFKDLSAREVSNSAHNDSHLNNSFFQVVCVNESE